MYQDKDVLYTSCQTVDIFPKIANDITIQQMCDGRLK